MNPLKPTILQDGRSGARRRLDRFFLAAIGLTTLAAAFMDANADRLGGIFWHLLSVYDLPADWLMLAILVAGYGSFAWRNGATAWVERLVLAVNRHRNAIAAGLWLVLCAGSVAVYRNHPLSMDEYAAVFQARVFAAGALHGQFPPELLDYLVPRQFQNHFLFVNRHTGAVVSAYAPGFSLMLAPFVWLGIPWACNPTIVAASFLMIGAVARAVLASPAAVGWALLLSLGSPAFIANGIAYYSMPAHLLLNLVFVWLLLAASPLRLVLAGMVGGLALALHNPLPHAVFAVPWLAWVAFRHDGRWQRLAWLALGYSMTALPLVVAWPLWQRALINAGPALVGAGSAIPAVAPGVAPDILERVWALTGEYLRVLRLPGERTVLARVGGLTKLWLWAAPMLLLLAWWGGRRSPLTPLRLLGASALITFFAYFIVPVDQGHGWGYRYFHSAWGVLPILGAAGALKLAVDQDVGARAARSLILMALLAAVAANGLRFAQMGDFMTRHLAQFPPRAEGERRLVMHNSRGFYAYDLIQNDPWLRGKEIVLLVQKRSDAALLLERFPGRYERYANRYGETYVAIAGGR